TRNWYCVRGSSAGRTVRPVTARADGCVQIPYSSVVPYSTTARTGAVARHETVAEFDAAPTETTATESALGLADPASATDASATRRRGKSRATDRIEINSRRRSLPTAARRP